VRIRRAVVEAIVGQARAETPRECCGLLIGSGELIEDHVAVANTRTGTVAFAVDPAGHFQAIRKARASGLAVVGAYHSHPRSSAIPSETDVREANDPDLLHLIVSLVDPQPVVRGYRIRDGTVHEIPLLVC